MNLLAELRRRNVIRMAGLYLVVSWLLVQVAGTVLPMFEVPAWVARAIVIVLALGFVPAVVFSWVFELTPEGLKRDSAVPAEASIAPQTGRRMDRMLLVVMALALGVFAVDRFVLAPGAEPGSESISAPADVATVTETGAEIDSDPSSGPSPASIAVLPFVNLSSDAENGYFADGISEELLNVLAGIDGLTVASRTSSFSFKGKDTSIPEIARALGVRHVLEGSVRRQGKRVRITAQLIRAGTDSHLWSQTFDRDLDDIFAVQEEIAQAIADQMVDLLPVAAKVEVAAATTDMGAYELMLRGRSRFYRRSELSEGLADLEEAVSRDPSLAEAWVYLAGIRYVLPGYEDVDLDTSFVVAREALAKARELAPANPLVPALEGALALDAGDFVGGLELQAKAAAMPSTDSTPTMWYGLSLLSTGYVAEAVTVLEKAQRADPLVGINNGYLGVARLAAGDEARGAADVTLGASQGWIAGSALYAFELARRGDVAAALERLPSPSNPDQSGFIALEQPFRDAVADRGKVDAYVAALEPDDPDESLLALGLYDEFLDRWTALVAAKGDLGNTRWTLRSVWLPSTRAVREDPRWFAIAREAGIVELWEARGWPDGCQPAGDHLACDH